jgi:hypothetical protein
MPSRQQVIEKMRSRRNDARDTDDVLRILRDQPWAMEFAPPFHRSQFDTVEMAVGHDGLVLEHANPELRGNSSIVELALHQNAVSFIYTTKEVRDDRDFALEACKREGVTLEFASKELRCDKELVLAATRNLAKAILCADQELKEDRVFMLQAVAANPHALTYMPGPLQADPEFRQVAIDGMRKARRERCEAKLPPIKPPRVKEKASPGKDKDRDLRRRDMGLSRSQLEKSAGTASSPALKKHGKWPL